MRRIALSALFLLFCLSAMGQNIVTAFSESLKGHCSSFDYKYSLGGSVPMSGSGTVRLQDNAFTMVGNGLDIRCDGRTRWTADTVAEECYIEDVSGQVFDFEANPALLVGAVDKAFSLKSSSSTVFNGISVTEASLTPLSKDGNIASVSLYFSSGKKPVGAVITTKDMNSITVTISNFTSGRPLDIREFKLDLNSLDKNYIINDLR